MLLSRALIQLEFELAKIMTGIGPAEEVTPDVVTDLDRERIPGI
jgi:hypothetical protein